MDLRLRLKIWLRLLVLQAAWSYRRMQTGGWLLVAAPVARRLAPGREHVLLSRLVVHFNTHPILAPLLIGAALHALTDDGEEATESAKHHLVRWMGTFGAIGDLIYWRALLWNLSWLGAAAFLVGGAWAVLVLAAAWAAAEVAARIVLFELSYRDPDRIAPLMQRLSNPRLRAALNRLGLIGGMAASGAVFGFSLRDFNHSVDLHLLGLIGAAAAVGIAARSRFRGAVVWLPLALAAAGSLLE